MALPFALIRVRALRIESFGLNDWLLNFYTRLTSTINSSAMAIATFHDLLLPYSLRGDSARKQVHVISP
jgi:hypothetical protein